MSREHRDRLITRFLDTWVSQDVEPVFHCHRDDVRYHDPNTRDGITRRHGQDGQEVMKRQAGVDAPACPLISPGCALFGRRLFSLF